ncbi:77a287eb-6109-47f4-a712-2df6f4306c0e [Sclerotinia trifoliorum]|uniref:77a287eb-6109-47f4-a712-2df6f4306c0e n=1 Tax=Sclerotinia trifoliorum TaxID=28548 RepID=A0A8H2W2D8_9HELO|nr:77a287eb-6109-47f4-a712-2df6f4306c0e [Sclerotinia trifoliorum]
MMSFIRCFFGLDKTSKVSRPREFKKTNRPQKQAPFNDLPKDQLPFYPIHGEVPTDFRVQSCLSLVQEENEAIDDGNNDVAHACAGRDLDLKEREHKQDSSPTQSRTIVQPRKHPLQFQNNINFSNNRIHRIPSNYSISIYSSDEIYPIENMESLPRRAKTPVFFIGQLERKAMEHDPSERLASEYQTVLPQRCISSYLDLDLPVNPAKRTLRKIKSQESLRDLCKSYATSPSIASDSETLVGSDGGFSPRGSIYKEDEKDDPFKSEDVASPAYEPSKTSQLDQDISLQICSDLLTSKLTATLHQNHTTEQGNRVSSLEILLMIEAYESIRKELRSDPRDLHVTFAAETALDQWIKALYTIYEDCHGIDYRRPVSNQTRWNSRKSSKPVSAFAEHQNKRASLKGLGYSNPWPIEIRT